MLLFVDKATHAFFTCLSDCSCPRNKKGRVGLCMSPQRRRLEGGTGTPKRNKRLKSACFPIFSLSKVYRYQKAGITIWHNKATFPFNEKKYFLKSNCVRMQAMSVLLTLQLFLCPPLGFSTRRSDYHIRASPEMWHTRFSCRMSNKNALLSRLYC